MKNRFLLFLLIGLFSNSLAFGQDDFAKKTHIPKAKPGDEEAYKKTKPEIEKFLLDIKPGMCRVNEVKLEGRYYVVMGTYDFEHNLDAFVEKLKNANEFSKKLYVETNIVKFGGVMANTSTIYAHNLWK